MHVQSINRPTKEDSIEVLNAKLLKIGANEDSQIIYIDDYDNIIKEFSKYVDKNFYVIDHKIKAIVKGEPKIFTLTSDLIDEDISHISSFSSEFVRKRVAV